MQCLADAYAYGDKRDGTANAIIRNCRLLNTDTAAPNIRGADFPSFIAGCSLAGNGKYCQKCMLKCLPIRALKSEQEEAILTIRGLALRAGNGPPVTLTTFLAAFGQAPLFLTTGYGCGRCGSDRFRMSSGVLFSPCTDAFG